ncbi:hypothetical protein FRX31_011020 [Thalictrum thalictroides]|uniref:Uncharacterized protein n=1 Tax=Thalictrum thalictroides TaxID=46969 RepID=A0A7J6WPU9_THATH|nr:hypothetical protein FRX31_011020 [Thalictrum thalictroides]
MEREEEGPRGKCRCWCSGYGEREEKGRGRTTAGRLVLLTTSILGFLIHNLALLTAFCFGL